MSLIRIMGSLSFLSVLTTVVLVYIVLNEIQMANANASPTLAQQLTMEVQPGSEECFYQPMDVNRTLTIDYAVTGSSQGGHDINFQLLHPNGRPLITEFRKAASTPSVSTYEVFGSGNMAAAGVYRFCFDNTFSHISRKTVTFTIINAEINPAPVDWEIYNSNNLKPEEVYSMTVQEITRAVDKVRASLNEIQVLQDNYRILESRDRSIGETNYERINFWSFICILMMISFSFLQVFVVRSLFEDKNKVNFDCITKTNICNCTSTYIEDFNDTSLSQLV